MCGRSGDTIGSWSHQVEMTLECAGSLFSWESSHPSSPSPARPAAWLPPHPLLGQRLEPPGKLQEWLMVITARTGRVAAPPIHHRTGVDPEN